MPTNRHILFASAVVAALAFGTTAPVSASPASQAGTAAKSAAGPSFLTVSDRARRDGRRAVRRQATQPGYDNVGSIVYDGIGYGYNRRTGERYMSCMIDEGYGRVTPCDNGNGGGGGGLN